MPRKDDFPALSEHRQEPKPQTENTSNSSSANWRDGERGDMGASGGGDRRGGSSKANAISFRRGGGGRTFEEPKKPKGASNRGDNMSQPGEGDEDQHGSDSTPKDNMRSPRRPQGEASSSSRGGSTRGSAHRGGGATGYAGPPRGGASPRGRGAAPSFRGRGRNGDNSNWNKDDEGPGRTGPSHQGLNRGPGGSGAPHSVNMDHRGPFEEPRGRGRGKFGRPMDGNADQAVVGGMEQMRIEDRSAPASSRNQDAGRSKRYSSQRQRMTTPPPANNTGAPIQQPPYGPVAGGGGSTAYYASYNDSPPPNYVSAAPAPLLPMAVAAQGAPPAYMAQPMYPAGPGPASFNAGPYYPPAPAPPAVPVGVPIGSPTQDNMYGGGIMYYDPGRQVLVWKL